MASSEPVLPLRIAKPTSSTKMTSGLPRPLTEISPTAQRRNSPSWQQSQQHKKAMSDSSPFRSSPLEQNTTSSSPRLFWQNRSTANDRSENSLYGRGGSPSPTRRPSVEKLQKASRVKNSNILALEQKHEYDPARVLQLERPLSKIQGNAFGRSPAPPPARPFGHQREGSKAGGNLNSPSPENPVSPFSEPDTPPAATAAAATTTLRGCPGREPGSPIKSSLSTARLRGYDPESKTWADDGEDMRAMSRLAKSVTFDAAPPQINEYEMATPDLSSIGSNSREGSYESNEDDESGLYNTEEIHCPDDSFDASLEDTDKTPVVGPDDWRHDHESSPMPTLPPQPPVGVRPAHQRTDSSNSNGEGRPLPPLPGGTQLPSTPSRESSVVSSVVSSATADHHQLSLSPRDLPSPPSASSITSEVQNIGTGKMTLEERLRLMMMSSDDGKSAAEQQRERRLRRGGAREKVGSPTPDRESEANDSMLEAEEGDDTLGDMSELGEFQLPEKISRESIMRRANGTSFERESDFHLSSPAPSSPPRPSLMMTDPDVPIPSTEGDDDDDKHNIRGFEQEPMKELVQEDEYVEPDHNDEHEDEDEHDDDDVDDDEEGGSVIINRSGGNAPSDVDYYDEEEDDDEYSTTDEDTVSHYSEGVVDDLMTRPGDRDDGEGEDERVEEDGILTPRPALDQTQEQGGFLDSVTSLRLGPPIFDNEEDDTTIGDIPSSPPPETETEAKEIFLEKKVPALIEAPEFLRRARSPLQALSKPEYDGSGWGEPDDVVGEDEDEEGEGEGEEQLEEHDDEPGTPDSVIHHPISDEEWHRASPAIPERLATIKASGSKLKTRPSATPSDIASMREARRHVSREREVPPIPERHRNRMSLDVSSELLASPDEHEDFLERHPSFKSRSLKLDLDLGLSLDQDFERVIEAQKVAFTHHQNRTIPIPPQAVVGTAAAPDDGVDVKARQASAFGRQDAREHFTSLSSSRAPSANRSQRGYLMRQNTKLVAASDKETDDMWKARSAGNSPVKQRPQSWTVEPWNGKVRPKSVRARAGFNQGNVPPLPGQESNSTGLNSLAEEGSVDASPEESGERGRLFVKVMGVKDLDLPLPKNERTWFSLTLDNGVHCVTTAWLELARNAPIGQEFELVVPNDLEFQLTLNVKLEKPEPVAVSVSPTRTKQKTSTFSRVFASPRKRKEMEMRAREEEARMVQQERDALARQKSAVPTGWDLLSPLAAEDGSFARAYVCLKEHESRCFGRPYMAEVACFNEWATEEAGFASSVKSKRGNAAAAVVRRAPYKIGKLELQLLFVPRPDGSTDEDMPKSMNSCIREMKAAEERLSRNWEGILSQQGGDCPYWRRRYFRLVGTKLTAYHEATRQPRATINLSNAKRLIDDRRTLTERETTGKNGKRRRSAFAEEEDGYMFVEEGFRIRFNNGEVIDFYADTATDKEGWMQALGDVIGRERASGGASGLMGGDDDDVHARARGRWCDLVLKKEETMKKKSDARRVHSRTKSMYP